MFIFYLIISFIVVLDQWSKYLIVQSIPLHESIKVVPNIFSLTHIQNTGAAWSILEGHMLFFYSLTLLVVAVLGYWLHREGKEDIWIGIGLCLMIGGAIGNFIDRLLNAYVIDMIQLDFIDFPIFNVADIALTVGVAVLLLHMIFKKEGEMR
ncbi:signal peptidase II [Allofustis seminis]|uniref:signal peptidase II n=1 Tax=Allofustis seminis TaxID=166939 RepID=UPI00037FD64A|nr:signal peptidase II [Allofustis seminis]